LIAICLIMASSNRWVRLTAMCSLPLLLISLIAAGSRGPTVAFIVGLIALIGLTTTVGRSRRRLVAVGAVVIAGAILIPVVVPGSSIGRSLSTIIGSSSGLSSNGRSALWAKAYSAFGAHTLFGVGTGGFAALDLESYPHNILLEVAAELGIVGAVAFIAMASSVMRRLIVLWRKTHARLQLEVTLLIALFLSALVNAIFSGAIQDNSDLWLWSGLAIGVYVRQREAQGQPEPAVELHREHRQPLIPSAAGALSFRRAAP
jgi:O-antigen ligase